MGERLVIINQIDGQNVNAIYYHWSNYTLTAVQEVLALSDGIQTYYDEIDDKTPYLPIDTFNLACLESVSGISSENTESRDYYQKVTGEKYEVDKLDRSFGIIHFTENDIMDAIDAAEGTVYIDWKIDDNGRPISDKTKVDLIGVIYQESAEYEEESAAYEEVFSELQENPKSYTLDNIKLSELDDFYNQLPEDWYDAQENKYYSQTG